MRKKDYTTEMFSIMWISNKIFKNDGFGLNFFSNRRDQIHCDHARLCSSRNINKMKISKLLVINFLSKLYSLTDIINQIFYTNNNTNTRNAINRTSIHIQSKLQLWTSF